MFLIQFRSENKSRSIIRCRCDLFLSPLALFLASGRRARTERWEENEEKSLDKCLYVRQVVRFCYLHCEWCWSEQSTIVSFFVCFQYHSINRVAIYCLNSFHLCRSSFVIFTCCDCLWLYIPRAQQRPNEKKNEMKERRERNGRRKMIYLSSEGVINIIIFVIKKDFWCLDSHSQKIWSLFVFDPMK